MEQYKKTSTDSLKELLAEKLSVYLNLLNNGNDQEKISPYKLEVDLLQTEIIRRQRTHGIDISDSPDLIGIASANDSRLPLQKFRTYSVIVFLNNRLNTFS